MCTPGRSRWVLSIQTGSEWLCRVPSGDGLSPQSHLRTFGWRCQTQRLFCTPSKCSAGFGHHHILPPFSSLAGSGISSHSLRFYDSFVSEPSQGLPQFVSQGYVDGLLFMSYGSNGRRAEPRAPWVQDRRGVSTDSMLKNNSQFQEVLNPGNPPKGKDKWRGT